jgi:predicted HTH transcriptional regulator
MSSLKSLIEEGEHQQQDFKLRIDDQKKIARTLCAFANTDGGRLLIGVKDNGKVTGIDPNEEFFMIDVAAQLFCQPPVEFTSEVIQDEYKLVLKVEVKASYKRPYRAKDDQGKWRSYIRLQDKTHVANKIQEKVWIQKKSIGSKPEKFGDEEISLLRLISDLGGSSVSKLYRDSGLPLKTVDKLLVMLICWGLVDVCYENGVAFYRISST